MGFNVLEEEKKNIREVLTLDEGNVCPLIFHSWSASKKEVNEILLCNFVVSLYYQIVEVLTPRCFASMCGKHGKEKFTGVVIVCAWEVAGDGFVLGENAHILDF